MDCKFFFITVDFLLDLIFLFYFFSTPLHISIMKKNSQVFEVLMENKALLDLQSEEGYPALWYALQDEEIFSLAEKLVNNGASSNIVRIHFLFLISFIS